MNLSWFTAHRSLATTVTSASVVVALIGTIAISSGGFRTQNLTLGDDAVWVTSDAHHALGRANTRVHELNSIVESTATSLDVVQQDATVLLVDTGNSTVGIVDPATSSVTDTVPLPPNQPQLTVVGDRAVILSQGQLWFPDITQLAGFDADAPPTLILAGDLVMAESDDGTVLAASADAHELVIIDPMSGQVTQRVQLADQAQPGAYQVTSAGGRWAVLDAINRTLQTASRVLDLSEVLPETTTAMLQRPSPSTAGILIASESGVLTVPLEGGDPVAEVSGQFGVPSAPVRVEGCAYAAWAGGTLWNSCADDTTPIALPSARAGGQLQFRSNGNRVLLNDLTHGAAWAVQDDNQLIDNWDDLVSDDVDDQIIEQNDASTPPEYEASQRPPVAVDDILGARPGRGNVLSVLLNDFDPNGDVVTILSTTDIPADQGAVELINNNQQLLLTIPEDAVGRIAFSYTITDGRGGTATAAVQVDLRDRDENSAPEQVRHSSGVVASGGRLVTGVLADWIDRDSDPIYLAGAAVGPPDTVSSQPDGEVTYTDAGAGGDQKNVSLTVSDGTAAATGILTVTVRPVGSVPIIADSFAVLATAGQEIVISPLAHGRGGNGALRLSSVPDKAGVSITPDFDKGDFRFFADVASIYLLDYSITDGTLTATAQIQVIVEAPADANIAPITVPHTVFVREHSSALADVLAGDIDPANGVLVITGVTEVAPGANLRVEIVEHRILRVTLTGPLEGPATFGYRISNGLAEARGTVTVFQIPAPSIRQAPIANPDRASVRAGDTVDIPILANDVHPDGDSLTLAPELSEPLPAGAGLAFTSRNVLRYLAPQTTGNFTIVYRVEGPDGQFANARVDIAVRERDLATNSAPLPPTVTARVLSGATIRIPIPLTGIDPDGDSVQLIGQDSAPEKGVVTQLGTDWIEYTAGEYSTGTDSFRYTVADSLGARATGTVRLGIATRLDGARNPVAVEDEVTVRPGTLVSVRVLGNDSDPDGGPLTIVSVEPTASEHRPDEQNVVSPGPTIGRGTITVTAPAAPGRYGYIYTIQNERGGTSSAFLIVVVHEDAPLIRPEANDTQLTLSDVLDRESVAVDVLANVFFAGGDVRDLSLQVLPGYESQAVVTAAGRVTVQVLPSRQIIPFRVSHPEDPRVTATAFIRVPGLDDALPQLRAGVGPITVTSGQPVSIDLNAYIVAASGRRVMIDDPALVAATGSNGENLIVDSRTLSFTSADRYYGPASITVHVTDGTSATDPAGRRATLILPITVTPSQNQPPIFDGGVIELEPGQKKEIDLLKLTRYPYAADLDGLVYSLLAPLPAGFSAELSQTRLTLSADAATQKGSTSSVTVAVRDSVNTGTAGRIELRMVPSTRPLAVPASDTHIAPRGATTTIDVLSNDNAANPFPDTPLKVVAVRGLEGASLPTGVRVVPSVDNRTLTVSVLAAALPADTTLQYQVADATGDPDRYTWGVVRIQVQDVPEPVSGLAVTGFGDGSLTVSFGAGAANNAPIIGYDVQLTGTGTGSSAGVTRCQTTTCTVATPGNGRSNAVTATVVAVNSLGSSTPVALREPAWSDIIPAAPTALAAAPVDGGLQLSWDPVPTPGSGSAVSTYSVTAGGATRSPVAAASCSTTRCSTAVSGLPNGTAVSFTVSARNDADPALARWNSAEGTGTPYGAATSGGIRVDGDSASGVVTVSWDAFNGNGDPIQGYFVQQLSSDTPPSAACTVSSPAPGTVTAPTVAGNVVAQQEVAGSVTSARFTGLTADDTRYSFAVWGYNRAGCAVTTAKGIVVRPVPDTVAVEAQMEFSGADYDLRISAVTPANASYRIRLVDAGGQMLAGPIDFSGTGWPRQLLGQPFGSVMRVQVQGCAVWGSCGSWSETLVASAPSVTFTLPGHRYDAEAGVWSWTGQPANGSLAAQYRCGIGDSGTQVAADTATTCALGESSAGPVWLDVTVGQLTYRYQRNPDREGPR